MVLFFQPYYLLGVESLSNTNTLNLPVGIERPGLKADLTAICEPVT
jgi:hypothetical protein